MLSETHQSIAEIDHRLDLGICRKLGYPVCYSEDTGHYTLIILAKISHYRSQQLKYFENGREDQTPRLIRNPPVKQAYYGFFIHRDHLKGEVLGLYVASYLFNDATKLQDPPNIILGLV